MNINIDSLKSMRVSLENQYNNLEYEINDLYFKQKDDIALEKVKIQDLIDKQLTLLDRIISNLENTPRLYSELMNMNRDYKRVMGD